MNYLIKMAYDGSKFNGFQRLKNDKSVQQELETALSIIDKAPVIIKGAGRTDRGVHATDQGASFSLVNNIPPERLINAINSIVRPNINITECYLVDDDFHARFNVLKKEYTYLINSGLYNPNLYNYMLFKSNIKISKLKKVAKLFIGGHDYTNFVSGSRDNSNAIIYKIKIFKKNNIITIRFTGKSFYRYMVRNLVGAMLDYNNGLATIAEIKAMLDNPQHKKSLSTASPNGLYLSKIDYNQKK